MSESLDGKVALITGAARGQGRSHAVKLAELGADIIAVDICDQIESVPYSMATKDDLAETVSLVQDQGRRIVAQQADVRDAAGLGAAISAGVAELGRIDFVLANAGIAIIRGDEPDAAQAFRDIIEVNLFGVWNTVQAAAPVLIEQGDGGSIVITSSTQGLTGRGGNGSGGMDGYSAAKHGLVGLMRSWAHWLAPHNIRVNSVHPTGVVTPMIDNDSMRKFVAENPTIIAAMENLLDVPAVESSDVTGAIMWLISDAARYITGVALPVDAGFSAR